MSQEIERLQKDLAALESDVAKLKEKLAKEVAKTGKPAPVEMVGPAGRVMVGAHEVEQKTREGWMYAAPPIVRKPDPKGTPSSKKAAKKKEPK